MGVRVAALLGGDIGAGRDTVLLDATAPASSAGPPSHTATCGVPCIPPPPPAFKVSATEPNATVALLTGEAWLAHHVPALRGVCGTQPRVYRVRFFQPTWCFSCAVGQLQ